MEMPGGFELVDVRRRDLLQGRPFEARPGARVGRPVARRRGIAERRGGARSRKLAGSVMRILEHGDGEHGDRCSKRGRQRNSNTADSTGRGRQRPGEPGQQEDGRDRHQQIPARRELPEIEPDLGERPGEGAREHRRKYGERRRVSSVQQDGGGNQPDPRQDVIYRPAHRREIGPKAGEPDSEQSDDDGHDERE